jgi:tetratricopeptide (TPR) repeat protein
MPPAPDPASPPAARSGLAGIASIKLRSWPALLLFLLAAGLIAWGGSRVYIRHRDRMLFAAAGHAIDTGDYVSAWFWLGRLYRARPEDVDTLRLIARLEAAQRSPEELAWRVRVIQTGPATLGDYLGWASAALRLGQSGIALEALDRVPAQWRDTAAYHEMLAGASAADGQLQAADDNFAAAAQLDPKNPEHLVNLTTLRLASVTDESLRQSARAALERLAAFSPLPAARALLADAFRQRDPARIARFRAAVLGQPGRSLDDELACIAAAPTPGEGRAGLAALWKSVATRPPQALDVAEWMIRRGDSAQVLTLLDALPASTQAAVPIQISRADAMAALGDWPGLRSFLTGKTWGDSDFLRVALEVRCARESGAAAPAWPDAIAACHGDGSDLLLLAQCAAGWSWEPESEALYWQISLLGYPARGPALKALWNFYTTSGNTGGLLRVAREQHADSPSDIRVLNNFAFLSLLTGIGRADAARIAEENFHTHPGNPNLAATYAYSLYLDGRYQEGLRVLSPFGERRLETAGAALYLALLEQATGNAGAATRSAAAVDTSKLLPEERLLLQKIGPKTS